MEAAPSLYIFARHKFRKITTKQHIHIEVAKVVTLANFKDKLGCISTPELCLRGASAVMAFVAFVMKTLHCEIRWSSQWNVVAWPKPQQKRGGWGARVGRRLESRNPPLSPMKRNIVEIQPLTVS